MEPTLRFGSTILVSTIPYLFSKPKIGDIVLAQLKGEKKYIIKRISKVENQKYFLTGDNKEDSLDSKQLGWFERKQILGEVILTT